MKVKEIMTENPSVCDLNQSLAQAAKAMWETDCGVLPVLKDGREVVGVITDRDICMAMAMRDCNPMAVSAEEVITGNIFSVSPEAELQEALQVMRQHQVRRLPVVSGDGELKGMLSLNDVVLQSQETADDKAEGIRYVDVVDTYKAICAHRAPQQLEAAATG